MKCDKNEEKERKREYVYVWFTRHYEIKGSIYIIIFGYVKKIKCKRKRKEKKKKGKEGKKFFLL